MVLSGLRGAVGFLTRVPIGHDERAWEAFRRRPFLFPLVGYAVGLVLAAPFALGVLPSATVAVCYLALVFAVTGINHTDGLADLGDAAVVHGTPERRREVMRDTTVGVGGVVAVVLAVVALGVGAWTLTRAPPLTAVGLIVATEVGAKLAMATLACLGTPAHDGLGSQLTDAGYWDGALAVLVAVPAMALTWPVPVAASAVASGLVAALLVRAWATRRLGGVSGDVFGASNDLARVLALHAGVVAWTLW